MQTMSSLYNSYKIHSSLYPNNVAVELEDGRSIRYCELDKLINKLYEIIVPALVGASRELAPTPLVAVMMTRDFSVIASILAILKSDATYVPVDPTFPSDRQSYIFEQSKSQLLITDEKSYKQALALGVVLPPVLVLHSETCDIVENCLSTTKLSWNDSYIEEGLSTNQLVYVLYTSGSTGKPKGVMVKQEGVTNIVGLFSDALKITETLTNGATLVLAKSNSQKDPFILLDLIKRARVNVVQATPTSYEMMLATGWDGDETIDFLVGGEAFRPSLNQITRKCKSFRNVYGPTETTIWSSSYTIPPRELDDSSPLPIGNPISRTMFYVVATEGPPRQLPQGEEGELWIGGIGVALGYLGRSDLTHERFILNPFDEGYAYRTGDIVKQLPMNSGGYIFGRRMDDQIKLNGYRIELSEIEQVFMKEKYVAKAVALVRHNKIVLYIQPRAHTDISKSIISEMKTNASRQLTYYMIPSSIVMISAFPTTANGKLDKNALPDPSDDDNDESDESQPQGKSQKGYEDIVSLHNSPVRKMEDHICDIILRLRGVRPKPSSSFAMMGIDSLGAVIFLRILSTSLGGIAIQATDIYAEGITINSFAKKLIQRLLIEKKDALEALGITQHDIELEMAESQPLKDLIKPPATFDDVILRNRRLVEGLRGFFAFMVLLDHFHHTNEIELSSGWSADTGLFVLLTGFTIALQLRHKSDNIESSSESGSQSQDNGGLGHKRLQFDWKSFLTTRAVGIFPILWLGLLVNAPLWYAHDKYGPYSSNTKQEKIVCDVLYPLGLQFLYRPQCRNYGPNSLYYASIIWTASIFYTIMRICLINIQNYVIGLSRTERSPQPSMMSPALSLSHRSHSEATSGSNYVLKLSTIMEDVAYNRPNETISPAMIAAVWTIVWELAWYFVSDAQNGRIYIQVLCGGCAAASVAELLFNQNQMKEKSANNHSNQISKAKEMFWRYFPDLIMLGCTVLLINIGSLKDSLGRKLLNTNIMYSIMAIYLVVSFTQTGKYRNSISRYIFESQPMNLLGYCSYALYVLQYPLLNDYLQIISDDIKNHEFLVFGKKDEHILFVQRKDWFSQQNQGYQFGAIVGLIFICWLIHKYYQDTFIAYIYTNILSRKNIVPSSSMQDALTSPIPSKWNIHKLLPVKHERYGIVMVDHHDEDILV